MTTPARAHLEEATVALKEERWKDAIAALDAARAMGLDLDAYPSERGEYIPLPDAAEAEMHHGVALLGLGDVDGALRRLDKALALDRDNPRILANRGHARRERGDRAGAIVDLTEALKKWPDYVFARLRRAQCRHETNDTKGAEADLAFVLSHNPSDDVALALWQRVRRELGMPDDPRSIAPRPFNDG